MKFPLLVQLWPPGHKAIESHQFHQWSSPSYIAIDAVVSRQQMAHDSLKPQA